MVHSSNDSAWAVNFFQSCFPFVDENSRPICTRTLICPLQNQPPTQTFLGVRHAFLPNERLLNRKINSFPMVRKYQLEITCRLSEIQSALNTFVQALQREIRDQRFLLRTRIQEISIGFLYISLCKGWIRCRLLVKLFFG